jgi:hypothetical protein
MQTNIKVLATTNCLKLATKHNGHTILWAGLKIQMAFWANQKRIWVQRNSLTTLYCPHTLDFRATGVGDPSLLTIGVSLITT